MKSIFLYLISTLLLGSCNLVKLNNKYAEKSLNKKNVYNASYDQDSLHINYWKGGQGPTLVFVHGFGGDALVTWEKELTHFSKTHTVIAYDLLWFGQSYSNQEPNLSTQTNALEQLLAFLQIDSMTLVGQSYGGFIALDFATQHSDLIQKIVYANSPGSVFNVSYLDSVSKNYGVTSIDELFVMDEPKDLQRLITMTTYSNKRFPKFLLKQMYNEFFHQHHAQLRMLIQTLPDEKERISDFKEIKQIPSLVLWGEQDELFPKQEGEKFANEINAQFISITKCGHAPQIDNHDMFLKILNDFILDSNH